MPDLPQTMQALVQTGQGFSDALSGPVIDNAADWLAFTTVAVPTPRDGQVLIRVRRASVNPSDMHFIKGEYGQPRVKGAPAGFEGCGDVVAGPKPLIGQRVAFVAGSGGSGAWAQYAVADAAACIPLRPEISDTDGAAQIVNPLTATAMIGIAKAAGDAVVITAATSQLGKLMIGLARDLGLASIAITRRENSIAALRALGAARVLNTQDADFERAADDAMAALRPRMMLDAVGDQTSEALFTRMPSRATWLSYGKMSTDAPRLTQMGQFIFMDKRIEGFWLSKWIATADAATRMTAARDVQARFADGRWRTDVSGELALDQVLGNLAAATRRPDGKVIITVWDGGAG